MPKALPDLHQGHAPIALHNAFHEALECLEDWTNDGIEPFVTVEGHVFPVTELCSGMLECTDLIPRRTRDMLSNITRSLRDAPPVESGDTYGRWAKLMLAHCGERFASTRVSPHAAHRAIHAQQNAADACASGAL
jgi:hypothetical protein